MQITNGIQVQFIPTTKFKDIGISVRFRNTLQAVSYTHLTLPTN